jgi:hypothetical protein
MPVRAPSENTLPTLEAFDAEFGLKRACDQSGLAGFLPLVGLVLATVGIFAALLWGSIDRQVWRLLASRAVEGWQQFQKSDDRDFNQQVDALRGEIDKLETSKNELTSAQQLMLDSVSPFEGDRRDFQQRYSIGSSLTWYDDWNRLFYRIPAEPKGGRAASPQTPGAGASSRPNYSPAKK